MTTFVFISRRELITDEVVKMWYELSLGDYRAKIAPLNVKRKTYEDVDKEGNKLKIVYIDESGKETRFPKRAFKSESGTLVSKAYKTINGKVFDKFNRTKEVKNYIEVDDVEAYDL